MDTWVKVVIVAAAPYALFATAIATVGYGGVLRLESHPVVAPVLWLLYFAFIVGICIL